jgi:HD-GYP domain-containing protein (c-di-GMP phosphodiesterase class II)
LGEEIVGGVLHHHERWDGKGYPEGLAGEEIPVFARVIGVADTFDAMASDRPYRPKLPYERVKAELLRVRGTQLDPVMVDAFLMSEDRILEVSYPELYRKGERK